MHTYFLEHAPRIPGVTIRAINALVRGGISTMAVLCSKSERELCGVRHLGAKTLAFALEMPELYMRENEISHKKTSIQEGKYHDQIQSIS